MKKFIIIKNSTIALSSLLILSSVGPSIADAATTYKVKSGKLVSVKTNKAVKGYKVYKSTLYYNGKKKAGNKVYKSTLYVNGKKSTGNKVVSSTLYVNGKKSKGYKVASSTLYYNGKKTKGYKVYGSTLYNNGKKATGYKSMSGTQYYNGAKFTGTVSSKYYKSGKLFTGFRTVSSGKYYYKSGKKLTGLYANALYVSGLPNKGQYVYNNMLYMDQYVDSKLVVYSGSNASFKGKLFNGGKLASGEFTVDGKLAEYVDGVLKTGAPTDIPPGTDPTTLTNTEIIKIIESYNNTTVSEANMKYVEQLLAAFKKLDAAEQADLRAKMTELQASLDKYKASISLTSEEINKKTVYTELTSTNIEEAKKLLAAYKALSDAEKANVTYPINTLQKMVTLYTITSSGITSVTDLNAQQVTDLIALYKTLSVADQASVKVYMEDLIKKLDVYVKQSNDTFVVVTDSNITAAVAALEAALKLTLEEQKKLNFKVADLQSKIAAYNFDQSKVFLTINNDAEWNEAKAILVACEALPPTTLVHVHYDINGLKNAIQVYEFNVKVKMLSVSDVDDAKLFIAEYNKLSQTVKDLLGAPMKDKLDNAKLTVDADNLQKQLNNAIALNITATSTKVEVDLAKDAIFAYQNAPSKVLDKVTVNTTTLKHLVAAYDFEKYYDEVFNPATKSKNGSVYLKPANLEIAKQEMAYIGRMFTAMSQVDKSRYNTQLDARYRTHLLVLDPDLSIKTVDDIYVVENLDNVIYADIVYNYDKEFKYTASISLVKADLF